MGNGSTRFRMVRDNPLSPPMPTIHQQTFTRQVAVKRPVALDDEATDTSRVAAPFAAAETAPQRSWVSFASSTATSCHTPFLPTSGAPSRRPFCPRALSTNTL